MLNDIFLFILNGGGWALKPILEKISVDKMGYFYFTFVRYFVSGIIAIPFIIYQYNRHGIPKKYKNDRNAFLYDVVVWGSVVSVVAISAIGANYYLLEKYNSNYVTPIAEGILLIFNAIFSCIILGERFTMDMMIGLIFILTGIFFFYRKHL
tara:strand:+ start:501 stop:956 length:456 start_codon:yes stop_codon:yes gene_type:complete